MQHTIVLSEKRTPSFLLFALLLLAVLAASYYYLSTRENNSNASPAQQLAQSAGIDAPIAVFQEAIRLAAKKLSEELGIDLENYDLSQAEYEAVVTAAKEKFGVCEQYRLYPAVVGTFNCFSCVSSAKITLGAGQTYRIGQTCGGQRGRYGRLLPEPGLGYKAEYIGNIFDVLVVEHVKLQLYRLSAERQQVIRLNNLEDSELQLPPGNKILR